MELRPEGSERGSLVKSIQAEGIASAKPKAPGMFEEHSRNCVGGAEAASGGGVEDEVEKAGESDHTSLSPREEGEPRRVRGRGIGHDPIHIQAASLWLLGAGAQGTGRMQGDQLVATSHGSLSGHPQSSPQTPACLLVLVLRAEQRWEDGWQTRAFTARIMGTSATYRLGVGGGASFKMCSNAEMHTEERGTSRDHLGGHFDIFRTTGGASWQAGQHVCPWLASPSLASTFHS